MAWTTKKFRTMAFMGGQLFNDLYVIANFFNGTQVKASRIFFLEMTLARKAQHRLWDSGRPRRSMTPSAPARTSKCREGRPMAAHGSLREVYKAASNRHEQVLTCQMKEGSRNIPWNISILPRKLSPRNRGPLYTWNTSQGLSSISKM